MKTAEECLDFYGVRVYGSMRERIISAMELHEQSRVSELERENKELKELKESGKQEREIWINWLKKRVDIPEAMWDYVRFSLSELQSHNSELKSEKDRLEKESEEWKKEAQRQLAEKQVFKKESETLRNTLNDFYDTGQLHKAIDNAKQALNPPKP